MRKRFHIHEILFFSKKIIHLCPDYSKIQTENPKNMTSLKCIITYESKLIRRNWLFRLFILGVALYAIVDLIPWNLSLSSWWKVALASSIPLRGMYFLNIFQSLVIIFLTGDITRKRRKADTRECLSIRPAGNGKHFLGEFLSLLTQFFIVDTLYMLSLALLNLLLPDIPSNIFANMLYLFTGILPTLVFTIGLSLFVNRLVKNPFVNWLILPAFLYISCRYLTVPYWGIFDFQGNLLPIAYSNIAGYTHLSDYLLHRSIYFLAGISLLLFATPLSSRLANAPGKKILFFAPATFALLAAISLGYLYIESYSSRMQNRTNYLATFQKYKNHPTCRITHHDITYRQAGKQFEATSIISVTNPKTTTADSILLYLNPSLSVKSIASNKHPLAYRRDHQAILVAHTLQPQQTLHIQMEYSGNIDEDIYLADTPNEDYFFIEHYYRPYEKYGKRTAFVSDNLTLLVPEILWYPSAVSPIKADATQETDYTDYTLHVRTIDSPTVLSQGIPTQEDNHTTTFRNPQNLPGLSLCIGNYVKRSAQVDSITVEYYTYPRNDFYLKPFDTWEEQIRKYPDRDDYLQDIITQCRMIVEGDQPVSYPFKHLKLIETPAAFLNFALTTDNIQPEIAFFPERICNAQEKPCDLSHLNIGASSPQEYILYNEMPYFLDHLGISHLFTDFNRSITSNDYQGINAIYNQMVNPRDTRLRIMPSRLQAIAEKGLKEIITHENDYAIQEIALYLKVNHLLAYLTTVTSWDSLSHYIQEFNDKTQFSEISFDAFQQGFEQQFGKDIRPFFNEWYNSHELPYLEIQDVRHTVADGIQTIDFKVGNSEKIDGILSIITQEGTASGETVTTNWESYIIKPGEYKHITFYGDMESNYLLSTNYSGCLPRHFLFYADSRPIDVETIPPMKIASLTEKEFHPANVIIVDNEDKNFRLIDSSSNRLKRLAEKMKPEDDLEYHDFGFSIEPDSWSFPALNNYAYGKYLRSVYTKPVGSGKFKAEWTAELPQKGTYEIFVHIPQCEQGGGDVNFHSNLPGMKYYYTVNTPEGKEEIVIEILEEDESWISLGRFTLPAGKSQVILDDRGIPTNNEKGQAQLIVADAVKWVREK